jgi:hypothetical protein
MMRVKIMEDSYVLIMEKVRGRSKAKPYFNRGDRRGSTSPRRGDRNFFKIKITRKMMDLFFTQDLSQGQLKKLITTEVNGGTRRKP